MAQGQPCYIYSTHIYSLTPGKGLTGKKGSIKLKCKGSVFGFDEIQIRLMRPNHKGPAMPFAVSAPFKM